VKLVSALRLEIEMFMSKKGDDLAEPDDERWLLVLELLSDVSHDLNTKLQSQQKLISDMFWGSQVFRNKTESISETAGRY
jgi:hypothetical protein